MKTERRRYLLFDLFLGKPNRKNEKRKNETIETTIGRLSLVLQLQTSNIRTELIRFFFFFRLCFGIFSFDNCYHSNFSTSTIIIIMLECVERDQLKFNVTQWFAWYVDTTLVYIWRTGTHVLHTIFEMQLRWDAIVVHIIENLWSLTKRLSKRTKSKKKKK